MSASLQVERHGQVLELVLDRPEKRNALSAELCRELTAALDRADSDPEVHAIVLSAAGPVFCAGMDLGEALDPPAELGAAHEQLFTAGARLSKPIVAAVGGPALGGGTGLVANAHVVAASAQATFGLTEIRIGLWPFLIFRAVAQAVGERRAIELSLTGRIIGAAEARELGLVHYIVEGDPAPRARELAATIAGYSNTAIRSGLTFVDEVRGRSSVEASKIARQIREQVFRTPEFRDAVRAFLEKR
jgi:enoyl-CoA hydratase/carnithine racemase